MQTIDQVINEVEAFARTVKDAWQIPRVEGELLRQIALSSRAKRIVEIGSSYGFSGLFWASALRHTGGHLHTIDVSQKKFDASRGNFQRAGVGDLVTNHLGDAHLVVPTLPDEIDIAFIDADKPSCRAYFDLLWPKLRQGGSILTDNAVTHRAELADFVKYIRSRSDAVSAEVAVGNGLEWTIKLP